MSQVNPSLPSKPSSTLKQESPSPTGTTRLLYLSSAPVESSSTMTGGVPLKAAITLSPYHKVWFLPPIEDNVSQYEVNLRSLHIFHTWPSVPQDRKLVIARASQPEDLKTITIPAGDWNALSLAAFLTEKLSEAWSEPVSVEYDSGRLGFHFLPNLIIWPETDCQDLLGFPDDYTGVKWGSSGVYYESFYLSLIPVRMSGPTRIHVHSNLSLFTLPPSGRLGSVPVNVTYGQMLHYADEARAQPSLCMDHHVSRIELHLTDQDNKELPATLDQFYWGATLSLTPVPNFGFSVPTPTETKEVYVEEV